MASVEVVTDPPLVVGLTVEVTSEPPRKYLSFEVFFDNIIYVIAPVVVDSVPEFVEVSNVTDVASELDVVSDPQEGAKP